MGSYLNTILVSTYKWDFIKMFLGGLAVLALIVYALFHFLSTQDATVILVGAFVSLWVSFGEGASRLDESIFDAYCSEAELGNMRRALLSRYVLSVVLALATLLCVLFF